MVAQRIEMKYRMRWVSIYVLLWELNGGDL
jgi:hypothetical protein